MMGCGMSIVSRNVKGKDRHGLDLGLAEGRPPSNGNRSFKPLPSLK